MHIPHSDAGSDADGRPTADAPRAHARAGPMASTLGLLAVIIVVMELTCRVEDWVVYRTPLLSRAGGVADLVVRDRDGMHGRSGVTFQKWKMNALGMRGPEAEAVAPRGTIRVVAAGASETFGQRESVDREYPRQLEDTLTARALGGVCGTGVRRFEVLNAAFAGMSLPTIEQDVRLRVSRLRPDVVVIYPTPVQYLNDDAPVAAPRDSTATHVLPAIGALRLRVWERLRDQVKLLLPQRIQTWLRAKDLEAEIGRHSESWRFRTVPDDRLTQYESDLRTLIGSVRAIGAVPVLATHANIFMGQSVHDPDLLVTWQKFYPRATAPVLIAFDSLARLATLRVGADSSVVTVDAAQEMAAAPRSAFVDFVHFSDDGAARIARVLSGGVLDAARSTGKCGARAPVGSTRPMPPE